MQPLANVSRALERNVLWPPIADAVDTFVRRKAGGADAYELTWRLIHVWESIAMMLTGAASARSREMTTLERAYLRCREQFHGRSWDRISRSFRTFHSALDGSAQARLNVLSEFSGCDATGSNYLQALKHFLGAPRLDMQPLVTAWERACDVPSELAAAGAVPVREAMRHVNALRNRFAHVPFPYDTIGDVADALEQLTEQVFSIEPLPWRPVKDEAAMRYSPLVGAITTGEWYLQGSASPQKGTRTEGTGCQLQFPGGRVGGKGQEVWSGAPFVALDTMSRPYVLTRARGEPPSVWEFTRFKAEANSVLLREEPAWAALFLPPALADYADDEALDETHAEAATTSRPPRPRTRRQIDCAADQEEALRLIRNQEYAPAIKFFEEQVRSDPGLLTGWLRLGFAQRELAMRIRTKDEKQALALFSASIGSLTQAARVNDPTLKAEALFERSKTLHRRGKFVRDGRDAEAASADALEAHRLAPSALYESWLAFLEGTDDSEPLEDQ